MLGMTDFHLDNFHDVYKLWIPDVQLSSFLDFQIRKVLDFQIPNWASRQAGGRDRRATLKPASVTTLTQRMSAEKSPSQDCWTCFWVNPAFAEHGPKIMVPSIQNELILI